MWFINDTNSNYFSNPKKSNIFTDDKVLSACVAFLDIVIVSNLGVFAPMSIINFLWIFGDGGV